MENITLCRWRVRRPGTERWRTLSWAMAEENARAWAHKEGYEIDPLPGSDELIRAETSKEATLAKLGMLD